MPAHNDRLSTTDPLTFWFWPIRRPIHLSSALFQSLGRVHFLTNNLRWAVTAILIGCLPLLFAHHLRLPFSQLVTGFLTTLVFVSILSQKRITTAMTFVAVVMLSHSAFAIKLSQQAPERMATILRGSQDYWMKTQEWILWNRNDEYRIEVWLPNHIGLYLAVPTLAYTSFGFLPFVRAIEELDLMNYYVGQLLNRSERPELVVIIGWHPWSLVRGLAYTLLVTVMVSWSLERFCSIAILSNRRKLYLFFSGSILALVDGLLKFYLSPLIRELLLQNLLPEFRTVNL